MAHSFHRAAAAVACFGSATALALAGCSPSEEASESVASPSAASSASAEQGERSEDTGEAALTFDDAVVRAKGEDNHMTAIFGTLTNHSDQEISITGFTSSLDAPKNQLHETRDGIMQEMTEPLVVPAGESHELAAGGDHLMVMDYEHPVAAGDTIDITFELADGSTVEAKDILVRTMLAGDEDYGDLAGEDHGEAGGDTGHESMDHGEMDHDAMQH